VSLAWRPQDDALLTRLEDEALFEGVWDALAPAGAPAPHPRAAGVLAELRAIDPDAVAQTARGRFAPALRAMAQPDPATLTPRLAHHLALLWTRVGAASARAEDPVVRGGAPKAWVRAVANWLWLVDEGEHLAALAETVIGDSLSATEAQTRARDAGLAILDELGATARRGAESLDRLSETALRVLARVDEAARIAAVSEALATRVAARAKAERDRAIEQAIDRVQTSIESATADGGDPDELVSLLWDAVAVWKWADRDVQVERFLVRAITPTMWDHYRDKRWDDIRALLRPLEQPIESLARRTEGDRGQLAYAAPCAQMLVFQAEVARSFDDQLAISERALRLCPTHRNARVVCADLLVERGLRRLDTAMPWETGDALAEAERDVRRALELYPQLKRLDQARRRLSAMGVELDE